MCLIFSYNIDLDGAEFTFIHYIQQLLKGESMYLNPYAAPYSITIYTPLYLHLVELASRFLRVNYITDIHNIYVIGRFISFVFTLLGLTAVFMFAKKKLQNRTLVLFVCTLYLLLLTGHAYAVRPDCMKISFFILFLYYYIDYSFESSNYKSKILSLLFAMISIASKQDAVIYILLIQGITFLYYRTIKEIKYSCVFIISTICLFIFFYFAYGQYCLTSLSLFNLQGIHDYRNSYNLLIAIFNLFRLAPFFSLFIYGLFFTKKAMENSLLKIFSTIGILAGILSTLFLFRPGSYLNYTYELIVISVFTLIIYLKTDQSKPKALIYLSAAYVLFVFMTNILLNNYTISFTKEEAQRKKYPVYYQMRQDILPLLENNKSIFNLDLQQSIFIADKNVVYGQEYHLDRTLYCILGLTSNSKLISVSSEPYDELFINGKVDYILTTDKKEAREVIQKYYPLYSMNQQKGIFLIYTPAVKK